MDDRRLTLIVVPHGDLETRTFEISYGRLRILLGIVGTLVLLLVAIAATWFYLLTQVARVPALEHEVSTLRQEQKKVAELARTLAEVEAQYEKVRQMLGADAPGGGGRPTLPPLPAPRKKGGGEISLDARDSGTDEAARPLNEAPAAPGSIPWRAADASGVRTGINGEAVTRTPG